MAEGERIYVRTEAGGLEPLVEERFGSEAELQKLLAEYPELLDGEQMRPGNPLRWILITREQPISDAADGAGRWSVDHLVIDQDAMPTLVEVKRGDNTQLRREVVGQMLDYAAHAEFISAKKVQETFERQPDADKRLATLLNNKKTTPSEFWQQVAENFKTKSIRLLFVADAIPDDLARIVEFLNEQMDRIEVLAVEVKRFEGKMPQTFMPRVIGQPDGSQTGSASGSKSRQNLTLKALRNRLEDDAVRDAAAQLLGVADECGASLSRGTSSVSIRIPCSTWEERNTPVSVGWIFLPGKSGPVPRGGKEFTFGIADYEWTSKHMPDAIRDTLEQWVGQFKDDTFTNEADGSGGTAWTVTYEDAALHIDLLKERLRDVLTKLKNL